MIPSAPKIPHSMTIHNDTRIDEYYWMRDKENPEVIKYIEAENKYTDAVTSGLTDLSERLYTEFVSRIKQTDETAPAKDGEYWYSKRTVEGLNYPIYVRRKDSPTGPEQVYLDVNVLAEGKKYMKVTAMDITAGGKYLAYLVDEDGYESCTLKFRDLDTGLDLPDHIDNVGAFSLAWGSPPVSDPIIFFTRVDDSKRENRVMRYRLRTKGTAGTDAGQEEREVEVFREDDVKFRVDVNRTLSGFYITIESTSSTTSEVWIIDTHDPMSPARLLRPREQGVMYKVAHQKGDNYSGTWWFITDHGGAKNFKVMKQTRASGRWTEVIPTSPDVLIENITCFDKYLVLSERRGGFTAIRIIDIRPQIRGTAQYVLKTPETICQIGLSNNYEYTAEKLRICYESPITPPSIYDIDFWGDMGEQPLWSLIKVQEVLGGYDASQYEVVRHYANGVPMSIVHRKGITLDGKNPGYLYGYGSYGLSEEPSFQSNLISLLDRGVVCVTAHVRGGSELGRVWKDDGKLMKKKNTFTDFIACAEELIRMGYTSPSRLAIEGGSAGGLLIGAVLNMRPDLFKVAHAAVPFVDAVTTMLDETIPLTTGEYEEWGNPNEPEAYFYMKSYSPYDNVGCKDYPNILITSGMNDPRVAFWEPVKWMARLRERATGGQLLLKMNMGAGHGGSSGRYDRLKEKAFEWAYLLSCL